MKNSIDQIEEPGNCKTADGYTKKANPGPKNQNNDTIELGKMVKSI